MEIVIPVMVRRRIALSVTAALKSARSEPLLASLSGTISASSIPASFCVTRMIRQQLIHCASILGVTSR
jgi:hypothetical protein